LRRAARIALAGALSGATAVVALACVARPAVLAPTTGGEPARAVATGAVGHAPEPNAPMKVGARVIRVLLAASVPTAAVSADADWRIEDPDGALVANAAGGRAWRVELDAGRLRAVRPDGVPTVWRPGALVVRTDDGGPVTYNGRRYRGALVLAASDSGISVVNRLAIDDYVLGVVAEEIGRRPASDSAAVEAQAVSARSYAATHLGGGRLFDVTSGTQDQVYGGVAAETPVSTAAVESTRGLVLMYAGRVVDAPYHSTCGGSTAAPDEVWRTPGEPYLHSVSDRIPGTDRYYCDISPTFRWTRSYDRAALNAVVARYLRAYAAVPGGDPGTVQAVEVDRRTASGRVGILRIATDRGNFLLRGNDIRSVLRSRGGEILNSTYFSVDAVTGSDGAIATLTLRGQGNGHGVGMCQWGAIGRARAGQDFRTILRTYYPGATVGSID
jgi:stage II sporulation protein D